MARSKVTSTADVVEAAARAFETKGYGNTTIDDICLEARISRPTVYKYIQSKPWLLDQMVSMVIEELSDQLNVVSASSLSPHEKIQTIVELHVKSATEKRIYYATVFNEQPELSAEAKESFRSWSHWVTHSFAQLLEEFHAERGSVTPGDSTVLANLTLSMLISIFRWYDPEGSTSPDDLVEQILLMLSGVLPGIDQRDRSR